MLESATTILLAGCILSVLAVAMAFVLGWANQAFFVAVDPKVEAIADALPGANCGGCGYVGCGEYAEAVAKGECDVTLCAPGGAGCAKRLADIMGVKVDESAPQRAVVHCSAGWDERLGRTEYRGEPTCAAANLVAGYQGCTYGCLGLGDCVRSCDYDAIHVVNGLAVVDYNKCVGCKACSAVCPRNIISMVPFKSERMMVVACSNEDFGNEVKSVCKTGCIGCKACTRKNELVQMSGNTSISAGTAWDGETAGFWGGCEELVLENCCAPAYSFCVSNHETKERNSAGIIAPNAQSVQVAFASFGKIVFDLAKSLEAQSPGVGVGTAADAAAAR
jgi:electron transport complex protein RnfB